MKKIVLTGGPGAGKTSALPLLKKKLEEAGVEAGILTETATEVLAENISPDTVGYTAFKRKYSNARCVRNPNGMTRS